MTIREGALPDEQFAKDAFLHHKALVVGTIYWLQLEQSTQQSQRFSMT